jgi:hypothetical protein
MKDMAIKERLPFYEQLLDKCSDNEEIVKEGAYLYFIAGDKEKSDFYLGKIKKLDSKEKVLLWFLGKGTKVSIKEVQEVREQILLDRLKMTDIPEEKVRLYLKLKRFEDAFEEIKEVDDKKREVLLSDLEAELGDYSGAYRRLSSLESREDLTKKRALLAFYSGNTELALGLLSNTDINPMERRVYVSSMLREATEKYKRIRPLIRR